MPNDRLARSAPIGMGRRSFLRGLAAALAASASPIPLSAKGSIFEATHPWWKVPNWCPRGWFPCDGRELPRAAFQELFDAIGGAYGKPSRDTFRIPDLEPMPPRPGQPGDPWPAFIFQTVIATGNHDFIPAGSVRQIIKKSPV